MYRIFVAATAFLVGLSSSAFALTGAGVSNIAPLETIAPVFTGLKASAAPAAAGSAVTISFMASEPLNANPAVTIDGNEAVFSDAAKSTADYFYTCIIEGPVPPDTVTVQISGRDAVGNPGSLSREIPLKIAEEAAGVPLRGWPLVMMVLLAAGVLVLWRSRKSGITRGTPLFPGFFIVLTLCCHAAFAASPAVTNVRFAQGPSVSGGTQVDIYYDLAAPNGPCAISIELSDDGGLDGYIHPVTTVSGDLVNVEAGTNKHVIWKIATDYANVDIRRAQLRVTADDGRVQYPVTFDANGGAAPVPASKEVIVGLAYGPLATTTRSGYTFAGWWTAASGGAEVTSGATVAITGAQTLYAHWTANTYTVTFDAQSGTTPSPASMNVTFGAPYGTLATTSRAGYAFDGWYTAASSGMAVTSGATVEIAGDHTLFAHWTEAPLPEVTSFSINGGAATATGAAVTLNNAVTNNPAEYMASESPDFSGAPWQPYAPAPAFSLSTALGGAKAVYFKVRNANGESAVVSDTISLIEDTALLPGNVPLTVVWCPPGSFQMGRSSSSELDSDPSEDPQHLVTFASGFWMGKYEVTQAQWVAMTGSNPSYFTGDLQRPVEQVSWTKITTIFLPALNTYTGKTFRLPSEAEWEYACRAGTTERFYWGNDTLYTKINDYAWYINNSNYTTHPVGTAGGTDSANPWGLYDMSGSVWEWCQDWYQGPYLGAPTDGSAWIYPTCMDRVIRGGGWAHPGSNCRSAYRSAILPSYSNESIGFRVAR